MLSYILKLFELFTKLPKSVQEQIINAIVDAFTYVFRRLFETKNEEDLKKATTQAVTPTQWATTTVAVTNLVPSLYSQKKKEEFANSVIELVKSDGFINQLSKRIDKINAADEESYVALCSIETKRLIMEMMDQAK
ncbi:MULTISPECIES: hypothetical protein [unclassified Cedecea]|uniref:hypothetical protein n=1 Tax=unclassified Cedecea TaxID=2649846 RepID=UPI0030190CD5